MNPLDDDVRADLFTDISTRISHHSELGPALMIGYVVITEWQTAEGLAALHHTSSSAGGRPLPKWRVLGYMTSRMGDIMRGRE